MPHHIVLDTNVIIAGLRSSDGASYQLLRLLGDERFHLHLSVPLLFEYEDVAKRPELGIPFSSEEIDEFVESLCAVGQMHAIFFLWRPHVRDPGDGLVLDVAIAGRARYIITFNRRDFAGCEEFGIEAITPASFLRIIGERT